MEFTRVLLTFVDNYKEVTTHICSKEDVEEHAEYFHDEKGYVLVGISPLFKDDSVDLGVVADRFAHEEYIDRGDYE